MNNFFLKKVDLSQIAKKTANFFSRIAVLNRVCFVQKGFLWNNDNLKIKHRSTYQIQMDAAAVPLA